MKKHAVSWLLFAFVAALPIAVHAASPKIELSAESWNMGEIFQWTNPSTSIEIRNTGDAELKILDVKASCGCTAVVLSDKVIRPGDKGAMKIDFASSTFTGPVKKVVKLYTNDPASPEKTITIRGSIKKDKAAVGFLQPDNIDLGVVAPYETRYLDVAVVNKGNIDLLVTGVDLPAGFFLDSSYPGRVPPGDAVSVRIGYRPGKSKGPINEDLAVALNNPNTKELKLKLTGYVGESARSTDAFIVTPTGFKVPPGAAGPVLELGVKNDGKGPIIIEGADSSFDSEAPKMSKPELAPGESGTISLQLRPDDLKPNAKGYVYIRVAVPVTVEGAENK